MITCSELAVRAFNFALATIVLYHSASQTLNADEVFTLVHPKCVLVPDDLMKSEWGQRALKSKDRDAKKRYAGFNLDLAWMKFVSGTSLKDVPSNGSSFVLQLLPTKIIPVKAVINGKLPGDVVDRPIAFTDALVHQPFKLWYVKGADEEPMLLGERVASFRASPYRANGMTGKISSEKPVDLARKGLVDMYERDLYRPMLNSYMPKLMPTKPVPGTAEIKPVPNGVAPEEPFPRYKVSRIGKDKDGNALIEVDLENRLPVWAKYFVHRTLTDVEQAAITRVGGKEARKFVPYYQMFISVSPGEKKTAQFVIPSSFVPATTKFSPIITVEANLFEGPPDPSK